MGHPLWLSSMTRSTPWPLPAAAFIRKTKTRPGPLGRPRRVHPHAVLARAGHAHVSLASARRDQLVGALHQIQQRAHVGRRHEQRRHRRLLHLAQIVGGSRFTAWVWRAL